jgi:hypothetical protein
MNAIRSARGVYGDIVFKRWMREGEGGEGMTDECGEVPRVGIQAVARDTPNDGGRPCPRPLPTTGSPMSAVPFHPDVRSIALSATTAR